MLAFDQSAIWRDLEARQAGCRSARHRQLLQVVIDHGRAEAARDLEAVMATLVAEPNFHIWVGGRDVGPKGRAAVRAYYEAFFSGGGAVFTSPKERIVVDDRSIAHEGTVTNLVSGAIAQRRGYRVPDASGHHLVRFRNVVFWSFDDAGLALGEDSYTAIDPDDFQPVPDDELPAVYRSYLAELGA